MRKYLAIFFASIMMFSLAACGGGAKEPVSNNSNEQKTESEDNTDAKPVLNEVFKVGVSMPTKSLQRWNQDGTNMKTQLEALGYYVDLQYAGDNVVSQQISQIENMISSGCQALVVAAIDGESLTEVLKPAKEANIPVISYDRLIMKSDAISYYATFDNFKVGVLQGEYIKNSLNLDSEAGPFNIELFTGAPDDNNIHFFFGGAMSILTPYIESGKLVVKSGQTAEAACATPRWSTEEGQKRMENLISQYNYSPTGTHLSAVYSSNDSVAQGITNALKAAGYNSDNFPIITGQDCDITSVKNMVAGTQSMSVFKDTRTLADRVVKILASIQKGETVEVNDVKTYDNGTGIIPSYLCDPIECTIDNYKELIIDTGYYTEAQIAN